MNKGCNEQGNMRRGSFLEAERSRRFSLLPPILAVPGNNQVGDHFDNVSLLQRKTKAQSRSQRRTQHGNNINTQS